MKDKNFHVWYDLPKEFRNTLFGISEDFEYLREQGTWAAGPWKYEPEAFAILRVYHTLYWDTTMPALKRIMDQGIRVAIFLVGMKLVDIVFIWKDSEKAGKVKP